MGKREKTFRQKLLTTVMSVTVSLIALLFISNFYSLQVFNGKLADSNLRAMNYRAARMEEGLSAADELMSGIVAGNIDFITLSGGTNPLQAHLSSYALFTQMKTAMPAYADIGALFIYSDPSGAYRDMFTSEFDYHEKRAIQNYVRACVETDAISYSKGWRYAVIEEAAYLFRFYGGRGTYVVAMVPLQRVADTSAVQIENEAVTLFVNERNEPLTERDFVEAQNISLEGDYSSYFLSGKPNPYMLLGRTIQNTNCSLVLAVSGAGYLDGLDLWQFLLLIGSFLALVLIPFLQLRLTRSILRPVESLRNAMERIHAGNLGAKATVETDVREFREMGDTFNTMMAQIEGLKIESYEKEIEKQRAELRYLQLQIRPHFFLNCLKSLYALTGAGQLTRVQHTILAFSKHIRYIFSDNLSFVPLSRELDHIRNYIEIQRGSSQFPPVCRIAVDPVLESLPIPPLSLQTFVENSLKHGYSPDHPLEIDVRATVLKSGDELFADLTVADNGPGFSEKVIREINDPDSPLYTEHHVGLNNIKHRMSHIYGDGVLYAFFNRDVGTVSEIFIPIDKDKLENGFGAEEGGAE